MDHQLPSSSHPQQNGHLATANHPPQHPYDGLPPQSDDDRRQHPAQAGRFTEEWDASQRGSSIIDGHRGTNANMQRSSSVHSYAAGDETTFQQGLPSRSNTLKKKNSMRRGGNGSIRRSGSRRSMRAGSVKSLALQSSSDPDEANSVFYCPIPTVGNPTDVLCTRFQTWRKVLKDIIAYFREIQSHYEHRSKALVKLANVSNNIQTPPGFLNSAGIDDALQFLRAYNKNAINEAGKAKEIEEDVILALTGLRSDLQQKIKEIKHLSGDFKNSVEKEMEHTSKVVRVLTDALGKTEVDSSTTTGKQDPFLLRLAVDRQVERQVDEENYLHQAYLNLESSGRELESIVVGEIQKAYNAYAGILKREADNAYGVIEELRDGPISMPKDQEWIHFVTHDDQFVDPTVPMRTPEQMHYPGQDHLSAQEIRAGLLERKSKYLKSYTAGWYVLSTTHLHEFKSADKAQAPIMSLYLPEQKLGSHSAEGGSSNKFILKGRQTGSMHRGHTWVFRAESHDTMMAWYDDIKALTENTPEERSQFVRSHSRSLSRSSRRSVSSDGIMDEDDDDDEPFSANSQIDVNPGPKQDPNSRRAQPGGRFPSDIQVNAQRGLQAPHSPSSVSSNAAQDQPTDPQIIAAAGALPASDLPAENYHQGQDQDQGQHNNHLGYGGSRETPMDDVPSNAAIANHEAQYDGVNPYTSEPVQQQNLHTYQQENSAYYVATVPDQAYTHPAGTSGQHDKTSNVAGYQTSAVDQQSKAADMSGEPQVNGGTTGRNIGIVGVGAAGFPKSESAQETEAQQVAELDTPVSPSDVTTIEEFNNVRPTSNTVRNDSVQTISNLHIPGGYPRNSVSGA